MPSHPEGGYHRSSASGLIARAGRAAEDPVAMTQEATWGKIAKHCAAVVAENPSLTPDQIARAARLRLRAEMANLSRKAAEGRRRARAARGAEAQAV